MARITTAVSASTLQRMGYELCAVAGLLLVARCAALGGWPVAAMSLAGVLAAFLCACKFVAAMSLPVQQVLLRASIARTRYAPTIAAMMTVRSMGTAGTVQLEESRALACRHRVVDATRAHVHACAITLVSRVTPAPRTY